MTTPSESDQILFFDHPQDNEADPIYSLFSPPDGDKTKIILFGHQIVVSTPDPKYRLLHIEVDGEEYKLLQNGGIFKILLENGHEIFIKTIWKEGPGDEIGEDPDD